MLPVKTENIELFGQKLRLSERSARDVNKLIEHSKANQDKSYSDYLVEAAICIADGLKINLRNLPWYRLCRRRRLRRQLTTTSLLADLTANQIFELAEKVYLLEGIVKKKVAQKQENSLADRSVSV